MSYLLTGASGFVGSRIYAAHPDYTILPKGKIQNFTKSDITDYIFQQNPSVIIHTAAISNTGYCAENPDKSWQSNVLLPTWIAEAARKIGARLICFSSDQVYAGAPDQFPSERTDSTQHISAMINTNPDAPLPHTETDSLSPSNVYGEHKLKMEANILDLLPSAILLRATWMYDYPSSPYINRGNFITNMYEAHKNNSTLSFSSNDYRGVTNVNHVVDVMEKLFQIDGGVYNFGCENAFDMYTTAQRVAERLNLKITFEDNHFHRNIAMNCSKLAAQGIEFMDTISSIK